MLDQHYTTTMKIFHDGQTSLSEQLTLVAT